MKTEQGVEINARNYAQGFYLVFREFVKKSDPPVFKELKGYEEYKQGSSSSISGIKVIGGNTIQFTFKRKVSGLFEFLSMPYYGFVSLNNFNNGSWKNRLKIDSSSGYSLVSWNVNGSIVLKKRNDWPLNDKSSAELINISSKKIEALLSTSIPTIIGMGNDEDYQQVDGFYEFLSIPSFLTGVVLSTSKSDLFKSESVRRYLRDRIHEVSSQLSVNSKGLQKTSTFYSSVRKEEVFDKKQIPREIKEGNITLDVGTIISKESEISLFFEKLLSKIFENTSVKVNWIYIDRKEPDWVSKYLSNNDYDLRIASVNTGDHPINWVVEMMFCSHLGISFPDPSKGICQLVNLYKEARISDENYLQKMEHIIREDAVVIPVLHRSQFWLVSNDILPSSLEPTSSSIYFDEIRARK